MDRENFSEDLELEEFSLDMVSLSQSPNYFLGKKCFCLPLFSMIASLAVIVLLCSSPLHIFAK